MAFPLWQPSPERVAQSNLTAFTRALAERVAQAGAQMLDVSPGRVTPAQ